MLWSPHRECAAAGGKKEKKNRDIFPATHTRSIKHRDEEKAAQPKKTGITRKSNPASASAIPSRLLREELAGIDRGGPGLLVEQLQGHLGGVLFGIVDVLAVIPVAGGDILALDGDGARPGGTTSCISDARAISIRCQISEVKVGVHIGSFCSSTLQCRDTQRGGQGRARQGVC